MERASGAADFVAPRLSAAVLAGAVRAADAGVLVLSVALLMPSSVGSMPQRALWLVGGISVFVAAWVLKRLGAYEIGALASLRSQARLVAAAIGAASGSMAVCLADTGLTDGSPVPQCLAGPAAGGAILLLARLALCPWITAQARCGRFARRIAIVGVGEFSVRFIQRLKAEPEAWSFVGVYDDRLSRVPAFHEGIPVVGTVDDLVAQSRREKIDVIVVALPLSAADRIAHILEQVGSAVADICLTADLAGQRFAAAQFAGIGANAAVSIREDPLKDWRAVRKAVFDKVGAALLLLVAAPLLALIAMLVRLDSPGPAIFRQPRIGFNNQTFPCFKFRTMHHAMADLQADRQTERGDLRVTRVGRWLRRFSLDELPQLVCVLQGTMSLVGPRPHAANTKAANRLFGDVVAQYALRHRVKPGITGWAQIHGLRGETQTVEQIRGRVAHDIHYIEHWSLLLDLRILVMTVAREIWRGRAY